MGEMIRMYYAANMRLWQARKRGAITEDDYRERQQAINFWLREKGILTKPPPDAMLDRGRMPVIISQDISIDPPPA